MKALIETWQARQEDNRRQGWAPGESVQICINDLRAYLTRCAPRTVAPTIEEFKAHEAVHGPWLKVRLAHSSAATPRWHLMRATARRWQDGEETIEISLPGIGWSLDPGKPCHPWRYCDEEGESVPGLEVKS